MSHFTKVGTKITDMDVLKAALNNMGLKLESKGMCRSYYGSSVQENVVKLPGSYDMYFQKDKSGNYNVVADFYGGNVSRAIGNNASTLMKAYAVEKLKIEAMKKGYSVYRVEENKFRIEDPTDSSPGYLEASLGADGNVTFKANGYAGSSCMKFSSFEEAFGTVKRELTSEYYQEEYETEKLREMEW